MNPGAASRHGAQPRLATPDPLGALTPAIPRSIRKGRSLMTTLARPRSVRRALLLAGTALSLAAGALVAAGLPAASAARPPSR